MVFVFRGVIGKVHTKRRGKPRPTIDTPPIFCYNKPNITKGGKRMKKFCFTIDDNIRFIKELSESGAESLFDHPYPAMLRRLHERFGIKIQLNLFYRMEGFDLSKASDRFQDEWQANADWLKLSFHSELENVRPYENSGYDEVYNDCRAVHDEILRFAGKDSLAKTTTVHYCQTTPEGNRALAENGVKGLLGLFGTKEKPGTSYSLDTPTGDAIREGEIVIIDGMAYAAIEVIINSVRLENLLPTLAQFVSRETLRVMIHEQYFYSDYKAYQPDFEEKLVTVFDFLLKNGFENCFFEEML